MLRILHILPNVDGGGVERMLLNYFENINRGKIVFDFIVHTDETGILENEIKALGGKIYHVPPKRDGIIKNMKAIAEIIKNEKYEIVHIHMGVMGIFALTAAAVCGVKVKIVHSHLAYIPNSKLKEIIDAVAKFFLKRLTNYRFACSKDAGSAMWGKRSVEKNKVFIMNNAIEVNKFIFNQKIRDNLRKELNLENKFVIGNVARISYQKNHELLLKIFDEIHQQNEDAVLLVVGRGEMEQEIKQQVSDLHLNNSVLFLGVRDDVPQLLQAMDIFLLPSRFEGLGIVYIEAQAAGLQAFASADVVPKEAKVSGLLHFIPLTASPKQWADQILQYSSGYKREHVSEMIKSNGYDITQEALKMEEFYLGLV